MPTMSLRAFKMMKRRKKRIEDKRLEKRTRTRQECMYLHLVPLVRMLLSCQIMMARWLVLCRDIPVCTDLAHNRPAPVHYI